MSPSKTEPRTSPKAPQCTKSTRRRFLGTLLGLASGFAVLGRPSNGQGRRALSLHEADYYKAHEHAG